MEIPPEAASQFTYEQARAFRLVDAAQGSDPVALHRAKVREEQLARRESWCAVLPC